MIGCVAPRSSSGGVKVRSVAPASSRLVRQRRRGPRIAGRLLVHVVAPAALVLAMIADDRANAFRPLVVGEPMPFYAPATLNGEPVNVGAVGELIVLNVWATWCTSCREEMADLNALQREFGPRGVGVVGVSVDGGNGLKVRRFAEREKLAFAVAHDPEQRVQQTYQVLGVPETFVIGKDGRLRWRHVGNLHPVLDSLRAAIAAALRDPQQARARDH